MWCSSRRAPSPTWTQVALAFCLVAWRIDEQRRLVQVARAAPAAGNVLEDVRDLLRGESHGGGYGFRRHAVVERVHADVEGAKRDAEEELFLRLRERIRVGRGRAGADLLR